MSTKFETYKGLNLPKIGEDILKFWEEEKVFEKSITSREGKTPYVFFEGPPSANGLPGVHHVLARTIKDIFLPPIQSVNHEYPNPLFALLEILSWFYNEEKCL